MIWHRDFTSLQMVLLSGCQTVAFNNYEQINGVAQCLSFEGIPFVIGMVRSISDRAATQFAGFFYQQLAYQSSVDQALYLARKKMKGADEQALQAGRRDITPGEWAIPVLYRQARGARLIDFDQPVRSRAPAPRSELQFRGAHHIETGFVGRKKQMRQFYRLFHDGRRAFCLWGYGGVGKSSLATRLAEELHHKLDYHVFGFKVKRSLSPEIILTELADLAKKLIDQATHDYILVPDIAETEKLNRLLETLLTNQKLLVLFDNFEESQEVDGSFIQPALKNFLEQMVRRLPSSSLLMFTTRYKLDELPLAEIPLGEFSFVDTWKKMDRLPKQASLATDRKRDIHRQIGSQPRALELLDSILSETDLDWGEIKPKIAQVQRKEQYDDLLLDILWEYLTDNERTLLQWLSLFRQPIPETELHQIKSIRLQAQAGNKLARMSMLFSTAQYDDETLHYVHRLTADFVNAPGRMESAELQARHQRLGDYWQAYSETSGSLDDLLEARYHFLQAKDIKAANRIAFTAEKLLRRWGFLDAALNLNQESYDLAVDEKDRSFALHNMGIIHQARGDYDRALELYSKSLAIFEKLGDISSMANSYGQMGIVFQSRGDYDQALKYHQKALDKFEKLSDISGVSGSYHHMGMVYQDRGDYDRALELYSKSLAIFEKLGDISGVSRSYQEIGMVYRARGDYDQALELYDKSLVIAEKIGDISQVSRSYHEMGNVYYLRGDYDRALELYGKSLAIAEKLCDIGGVSYSYHQMGMVYQERGDYDRALELFDKSLVIAEKIGDISQVSRSYHGMGNVYYFRGDYDRALELYGKSLAIFEKLGDISSMASSQAQIGNVLMEQYKFEEAIPYIISAYQIFQKIGSPYVKIAAGWLNQIKEQIGEEKLAALLERLIG